MQRTSERLIQSSEYLVEGMTDHLDSLSKLEFPKILSHLESLAATELGRKRARALLPTLSPPEARRLSHLTTEMKLLLRTGSAPPFAGITDCRPLVQRAVIQGSVLDAPELRRIADFLVASLAVKKYFLKSDDRAEGLRDVAGKITSDNILEFNIRIAIDENGNILDTASKILNRIRQDIANIGEKLRRKLETVLRKVVKLGWAQDEIITTRDGRMVIPVKAEHKQQVSGFIHSSSSSGYTVFVEPAETLEINNKMLDKRLEEQREIARILRDLTQQVAARQREISSSIDALEELDTIYAQASYSLRTNGAEITLGEGGRMSLLDARHPLLVEQKGIQDVIQMDLELGRDFRTLVITGPNAGGKSVALKAIGLITAMAHAGMHVPASAESSVPWIENLFVDIGDEQSIENNLSTFTSHLEKLRFICKNASPSSLVLVDEIAGGTDPKEGGAIAAAVLQHLTARGSFTIATTHNSFLKAFAHEAANTENASMEFDQVNLMPTYRLRVGIPGSSYAIEIADRLQFPQVILKQAKNFLGKETENLERLLVEIDSLRQQLLREKSELEKTQSAVRQRETEYSAKLADLQSQARSLRENAKTEARAIVEKANSLIERAIREIREHNAQKENIKEIKTRIKDFASTLFVEETPSGDEQSGADKFDVGDHVALKGGQEVGEIIEILDRNHLMVLSGSSRLKVARSQLIRVNREVQFAPKEPLLERKSDVNRSVDIRGMSGDDAIVAVDKFIDDAVLSGLVNVQIVHGKGTGALRKKILDYLQACGRVRAFHTGEWHEGGLGVTIVDLR